MSKLVKAVVGTVLRLKCPECAEVFDMSWDIAEDVVDAVSGEVVPWVCNKCQQSKKNKEKEILGDGHLSSDRQSNRCRPTICEGKRLEPVEDNNNVTELEINNEADVIYNSEMMKKDISEIKASIIGIKQELEQLRFLIVNRPDS